VIPLWHMSSRSGVATLRTAIYLLLTYLPSQHPLPVGPPPSPNQNCSEPQGVMSMLYRACCASHSITCTIYYESGTKRFKNSFAIVMLLITFAVRDLFACIFYVSDVLMMYMWTKSSFCLPEIIIDVCTGDLTKHSPAVKLKKIHIVQLLFYRESQFDVLH